VISCQSRVVSFQLSAFNYRPGAQVPALSEAEWLSPLRLGKARTSTGQSSCATVNKNAENQRLFNALRPYPTRFEPLLQKHRLILDNPFIN
jgi:hypothetical protein